jgi:hypothetical protein
VIGYARAGDFNPGSFDPESNSLTTRPQISMFVPTTGKFIFLCYFKGWKIDPFLLLTLFFC